MSKVTEVTPDEQAELDEQLEWASSENDLEESSMLELIQKLNIPTESFNTFTWVKNFEERIKDPTTRLLTDELCCEHEIYLSNRRGKDFDTSSKLLCLDGIERLETQWQLMRAGREREGYYEKHYRIENPIELFLFDLSYGDYPPPELLVMISKCFNLYLLAEGELTLEDVFFGKLKKRSGNFAKRKATSNNFKEFHYQVIREKECNKNFSLEKFALHYFNMKINSDEDNPIINVTEDNIESYIIRYYRWKKKHLAVEKTELKGDSNSSFDVDSNTKEEAIDALVCLGYERNVATQEIKKLYSKGMDCESLIRISLISLM